ncbi:MAG: DUF1993 domain-containing protein [Alphaproteobacteria bacterium]|nr:DUF1993 domain-containing protein [Alphaproteobacteria bacterium]MBV9693020.1 DUF1993 domain-containing protein [Alphaproteobacteria bacterium]
MTISMYQASAPVYLQYLNSVSGLLDKAEAFAEAKKIDPARLLDARLYPDMHPLVKQVQIFTDQATRGMSRLAGSEPASFPDTETSFAELKARIARAIAHVQGFRPEQIDGSESRDIVMKTPRGDLTFKGQQYLLAFSLPNFFFHATAAYAILRHVGVEIGKMDFMGGMPR